MIASLSRFNCGSLGMVLVGFDLIRFKNVELLVDLVELGDEVALLDSELTEVEGDASDNDDVFEEAEQESAWLAESPIR